MSRRIKESNMSERRKDRLPLFKDIHEHSRLSYRENESSGKGETYRQRIVQLLTETGESMTDRQIIEALNVTDVNNIRPEITRLKQKGVLRESGKVKCPVTGKTVRTVCIDG
jgi:predicted HTH transcriptional regulator